MPELAYINNRFCPISEARVSIEDRGFQFGDGVYEVLVSHGSRVFRFQEHVERLQASLSAVRIDISDLMGDLERTIHEGISRAGFAETMIYLQVTRGAAPRIHVPASDLTPTIVMTFKAKPVVPAKTQEAGLKVRTTPEIRWARCHIKSVALLPSVLAKMEAMAEGYDDAVFVTREGEVLEATAANIFVVRGDQLWTPPTSEHILHGITRGFVLECALALDIPVCEERMTIGDLQNADEAFLSSTTIDVLAITNVDGVVIGASRPGPVTLRLNQEFRVHMRCDSHQNKVGSLA